MGLFNRALCALPLAAALFSTPASAATVLATFSGSSLPGTFTNDQWGIPKYDAYDLGTIQVSWTVSVPVTVGVGAIYEYEWDEYTREHPLGTGFGNEEVRTIEYQDDSFARVGALRFRVPNTLRVGDGNRWILYNWNPEEFWTSFDTHGATGPLTYTLTISAVPEPGTWALAILGLGLAGSALRRSRAERYPA